MAFSWEVMASCHDKCVASLSFPFNSPIYRFSGYCSTGESFSKTSSAVFEKVRLLDACATIALMAQVYMTFHNRMLNTTVPKPSSYYGMIVPQNI